MFDKLLILVFEHFIVLKTNLMNLQSLITNNVFVFI